MGIKRKVVVIFGKYGENTDFVLEPACEDKCKCELCKDAIWIEEITEPKGYNKIKKGLNKLEKGWGRPYGY